MFTAIAAGVAGFAAKAGAVLRPFAPYLLCAAIGAAGMAGWEHVGDLSVKVGPARLGVSGLGVKLRRHIEADAAAHAKAVEKARKVEGQSQAITDRIGARSEARQIEIRTVTRTIVKEVPVHVTPEADRRYPLPNGLVRVHDAAALGVPPAELAPVGPDDAPSAASASDLGVAVAENYGACHADQARFADLQDWVAEQLKLFQDAAGSAK